MKIRRYVVARRVGMVAVAVVATAAPPLGVVATSVPEPAPTASPPPVAMSIEETQAVVTPLAEFGSDDFVTGSTIGPDGALYVTDGVAGAVLRIDGRTGDVSPYADGLPPKAFPMPTSAVRSMSRSRALRRTCS